MSVVPDGKFPSNFRGLAGFGRLPGRGTVLSGILTCTFFVLYFFYVRECLDPRLLYHANKVALPSGQLIEFPIFMQGAGFLKEFLVRPGGPMEYVAAGCCQYYYYTHLGALILTAVALFLCLLSDWLIRISGARGCRGLRFVPPLLLLIAYNQYTFHLQDCMVLIAVLIPAVSYVFVASRWHRATPMLVLFIVAAAGLYYVASGPYLLFVILCASFELLTRRRYGLGGTYLLAAGVISLLGSYFFRIPLGDAYLRPFGILPLEETMKALAFSALYLFFVLVVIALPFRQRLARLASVVSSRAGMLGKCCSTEKFKIACGLVVLVAGSVSVALYTLDKDARRVLRANYLARMEMWKELLEEVDSYASWEYPASVTLDVNRALFETDQLGSRMFRYPQSPSRLFETGAKAVSYKGGCEVLLKLGRINEAEHTALESLEMNGARPETLRQLAIIYIVKGQPEAARVFLGALSKDIVHEPWAKDYLRRLDKDPLLSSDPQIQELRSVMPRCDMLVTSSDATNTSTKWIDVKEAILLALLARNRNNRMAFEYLMAYYLLTRQPEKVACNIGRLDDFDYPAIPEHYAEAILLYGYRYRGGRHIDVGNRTLDKRIDERVREVLEVLQDSDGDQEAIDGILAARFPNSYCRYLLTGTSGGAR